MRAYLAFTLLFAVSTVALAGSHGQLETRGTSLVGNSGRGQSETLYDLDTSVGQVYASRTDWWMRYYAGSNGFAPQIGEQNANAYAWVGEGKVGASAIVTGGGQYAPSLPYSEQTSALASASLFDSLTITSDSLAYGTPVLLSFRVRFDGNTWASGGSQAGAGAFFNATGNLAASDDYTGVHQIISDSIDRNGMRTYSVTGSSLVKARSYVGGKIDLALSIYLQTNGYGIDGLDAGADFSHTLYTGVDFLTPGVGLISDSGYDYTRAFPNPVPEPTSMAALGLGLVVFARKRIRRPS